MKNEAEGFFIKWNQLSGERCFIFSFHNYPFAERYMELYIAILLKME